MTVLVVQKGVRDLSAQAIENIYRVCKELGVDVGLDPKQFIETEMERSRRLALQDLPIESAAAHGAAPGPP